MAYVHSKHDVNNLDEEIIPTAAMIKNIPLSWKPSHLLHLMSQMKLPAPRALRYLYDNSENFRGMAFADFATPAEARQVIQELNYCRMPGGKLNVQYKKKRSDTVAKESVLRRGPFRLYHFSHSVVRNEPYVNPQAKISPASRRTRQQTPPAESYDLLMGYQTEPLEKQKLTKLLAQTGDYQEAINEFAKNRAWEAQEEAYQRSIEMEHRPILEMRAATPEELQQIADMESWFGLGGAGCSSGSFTVTHGEDWDVADVKGESKLESINIALLEKNQETTSAEQGAELDERKDKEDVEEGRVGIADVKLGGTGTGRSTIR